MFHDLSTSRIRSGVTLLEILIAMFVIAIGLLGVAAMLPIGHYYVKEAEKADRSAALAEASFNFMLIKRDDWLKAADIPKDGSDDPVPFVIDPLGLDNQPDYLAGSSLRRHRIYLSRVVAKHWFVGHDDLAFTAPIDVSTIDYADIFTPDDIEGLKFWVDANSMSGLSNNSPVTSWSDLSSNVNTLNQSDSNKQPKLQTDQINGYPAVFFDEGDHIGISGGVLPDGHENYTFVLVWQNSNTGGDSAVMEQGVGSTGRRASIMVSGTGNFGFVGQSRDWKWPVSSTNLEWHQTILTVTESGTNNDLRFYDNGFSHGPQNLDLSIGTNAFNLGANHSGGEQFEGRIAEAMIYDHVLSDEDRTALNGYMTEKYFGEGASGAPVVDMSATKQFFFKDEAGVPIKRAYEGSYSWIATFRPKGGDIYNMSIAVFFKRDYTKERTVGAAVIGSGYGGGELQLGTGTPADTEGLKSNRWILLLGTNYCQWYRIIAVGEGYVSLDGPDILDPSVVTSAVLFDEVVSVTENTIEIK